MSTPTDEAPETEGESTEAEARPWNQRTTPHGHQRPRAADLADNPRPRRPPTDDRTPPPRGGGATSSRKPASIGPGTPRREEPPARDNGD